MLPKKPFEQIFFSIIFIVCSRPPSALFIFERDKNYESRPTVLDIVQTTVSEVGGSVCC
jgi:hypothetical protein